MRSRRLARSARPRAIARRIRRWRRRIRSGGSSGTAPWMRMPAGKSTKAGRSLTRSSKNLLGRPVMAEVRALPIDTSPEIRGAPSMRGKPSRKPPSSTHRDRHRPVVLGGLGLAGGEHLLHVGRCQACLVRMSAPEYTGMSVRGLASPSSRITFISAKSGSGRSDRAWLRSWSPGTAAAAGRARSST